MINIGRWALLAVLGASVVGCGGGSGNAATEETGVALEIFGPGETSQILAQQLGAKLTVDGSVGVSEGDSSATIYRDESFLFIAADASTTDEFDEDQRAQFFEVNFLPQYINGTFDSISFELNNTDDTYGVDFAVYAAPRAGGSEPLWRYSDMINWCVGIEDNVRNAMEGNTLPSDFTFDFNTDIETTYDAPTELAAAERWSPTLDIRYATCPLATTIGRWIGRKVGDDVDGSIEETVYAEYQEYADEYAAIPGDCETDENRADRDECDEPSKPTASSLAQAVLLNAEVLNELGSDSDQFEIEIELGMNEFSVVSDPFTYELTVRTADFN